MAATSRSRRLLNLARGGAQRRRLRQLGQRVDDGVAEGGVVQQERGDVPARHPPASVWIGGGRRGSCVRGRGSGRAAPQLCRTAGNRTQAATAAATAGSGAWNGSRTSGPSYPTPAAAPRGRTALRCRRGAAAAPAPTGGTRRRPGARPLSPQHPCAAACRRRVRRRKLGRGKGASRAGAGRPRLRPAACSAGGRPERRSPTARLPSRPRAHLGKRVTSVYVSSTACRRATAASCCWSRSRRSTWGGGGGGAGEGLGGPGVLLDCVAPCCWSRSRRSTRGRGEARGRRGQRATGEQRLCPGGQLVVRCRRQGSAAPDAACAQHRPAGPPSAHPAPARRRCAARR